MGFGQAVKTCLLRKYFTFSGRASRSEFWWFSLFCWLALFAGMFLNIGMSIIATLTDLDLLRMVGAVLAIPLLLLWLASIIPAIAVTVRRLHDRGLSGWWYLGYCISLLLPLLGFVLTIVMIVILARDGEPGANRFGANPLEPDNSSEIFA